MTVRLAMVNNHPVVRAGVRSELEHSGANLVIVGEAADIESAVTACHGLEPDITFLDVHLPGGREGGGAEVSARYQDIEGLCFLVLSVSSSPKDVIQVVRPGVRGYVTESASTPKPAGAIQRIASGNATFSPRFTGFVLDVFGTGQVAIGDNELDLLSAREQEVMRLIARGYTCKEADNELFISAKTMEAHMLAMLRRLQLSNRNELTHWAMQRHAV